MNFRILLHPALVVFCLGCAQPRKDYVAKVKLLTLKDTDIFKKELAYDVLFDSQELEIDSVKNKSRQLFLKAIDLYKNKKNPEEAIPLFKQSILTLPEAKAYYELGNALVDAEKGDDYLNEAILSYEVADYLNFQPRSMLFYKKACAYNMTSKKDNYNVNNALYMAFNNGFTDTLMLQNDKHFHSFLDNNLYKTMMVDMIARKLVDNPQSLFGLYLQSFPESKMPFEIDLDKLEMKDYNQSISYDFVKYVPEMQNTSFGREVSHDYFFVAYISKTPVYTAVLYSSTSYYGEMMQPIITKLVTYSNEGNIINSKIFSGQFSAEKVKTGRIENNEITLKDYKRYWKQPIDKVPFEENAVDKYELVATATFRLDDSGKILEESVPPNYSDSNVVAKK